MLRFPRSVAFLPALVLVIAACTGGGATTAPSSSASTPAATSGSSVAPSPSASSSPSIDPNSLLGKIVADRKIRISTDPNYKPFSFANLDGTYDGDASATASHGVK